MAFFIQHYVDGDLLSMKSKQKAINLIKKGKPQTFLDVRQKLLLIKDIEEHKLSLAVVGKNLSSNFSNLGMRMLLLQQLKTVLHMLVLN